MKNYQKPNLDIKVLAPTENLSSLAAWLEENTTYADAGITTYVIVS